MAGRISPCPNFRRRGDWVRFADRQAAAHIHADIRALLRVLAMGAPHSGALADRDFVKMNGLGNEIVIVDLRHAPQPIAPAAARAAARKEPYDQLMALYPARGKADAAVRIYNNDGSQTGRTELNFETSAGLVACRRSPDGLFTVDMGRPRWRWGEIPLAREFADTRAIELSYGPPGAPILQSPSAISTGNPHAIFWVDDPAAYDLATIGH